jgi:hypothetical protein
MLRRARWLPVAILLAAFVIPSAPASAGSAASGKVVVPTIKQIPVGTKYHLSLRQMHAAVRAQAAAVTPARYQVGDQKYWLAIDDLNQILYLKLYTLRGIGNHIEVWVASDSDDVSDGTDFPAGDCRNGTRTEITDQQVNYLMGQFDDNIYPKEANVFSTPPHRDGMNSLLADILGLPPGYYHGGAKRIVTLIDNVRDDQFYDTNNAHNFSYIAGFFSSQFNEYVNRNVMTIDAFDWLHRTGPNPPNDPTTDPCTSAPARRFLYEGVFAHEYQHLLEYYQDPGEENLFNEGISDWAQTLTGYVDTRRPITDLGFDSHTQCFLGWLGVQTDANPIPRQGGPENSLNLWGDQTDYESEILCDYGAAYTFQLYLAKQYGKAFMGELHRNPLHGFDALRSQMATARSNAPKNVSSIVSRWAAMVALDGVLDDGAKMAHGHGDRFSVGQLHATINWDTDQAYSTPGAPPNGSDYVRLRDANGDYLKTGDLSGLRFDAADQLPELPIEWTVDQNPPGRSGNPALFAGTGDNLDRSIVREVAVPAGSPELTFDTDWSSEEGYDYAYVQVSTDGGATYTSIPCSDQVAGPLGPAYNGESGGFVPESCDLSDYAGQTIVLAFRFVTDSSVHFDGFWVDNVAVDGTVLSDGSTLDGWQSLTQYRPIDVRRFYLRLVAYDSGHHRASQYLVPLQPGHTAHLSGKAIRDALGIRANVVSAIVTYVDTTETVNQYAPYTLRVNGVLQPGGS